MGQGQPNAPSPFLAGIGKGHFLGTRAAVLQRFDGIAWGDIALYPTIHEADAALDHMVGEGKEPGALRVVDAAPSRAARALMIVGAVVCVAVAVAIVWIFVAGS
jgi:cytochrome bd-type quinol oxidase subunit 2